MRSATLVLAATFLLAAGSAVAACPMHTAGKDQTVASSGNASSTPIPAKAKQQGKDG